MKSIRYEIYEIIKQNHSWTDLHYIIAGTGFTWILFVCKNTNIIKPNETYASMVAKKLIISLVSEHMLISCESLAWQSYSLTEKKLNILHDRPTKGAFIYGNHTPLSNLSMTTYYVLLNLLDSSSTQLFVKYQAIMTRL